ncbi:MAG: hypothetical protein ACLPKE_02265 [Streptosporangiaceae bacterium]
MADTVSQRHAAIVRSNPVALARRSRSAVTTGRSCSRCASSSGRGSAPARSSRASLASISERTSRLWPTGRVSQASAAARPAGVTSISDRTGPLVEGSTPAVCTYPSCSSRCSAR